MTGPTRWLRPALDRLGYVVHRWPATRFDGMADALTLLIQRGYRPRLVIDCGANTGQWMTLASARFSDAVWHLIEPQPACIATLERLTANRQDITIHRVAVSSPGRSAVRMLGGGSDRTGTGNFVALPDETDDDEQTAEAKTLDELFANRIRLEDRALLKLDVEQHELEALEGAERLLSSIEVVLTEVSVFDVTGKRPTFGHLFEHLRAHGFEFYDVACLSGRPRDKRLRQMDVLFVRRGSALLSDHSWA